MPSQDQIIWQPQAGPQTYLISCPVPEILIGGARGGGKTQGELGKYLVKSLQYKSHFNGIIFRQEMPQADDLIEEAKEIYLRAGATWQEQKRQFQMPGGGILRFRPLESEDDARKYQGQNLTDCNVQEAGNYSDPAPIDKLWGALRSKHGVPCQLILDANPGGPGHTWIYERFIEPAPNGLKIITVTLPNGTKHYRVYIPARVKDNQLLLKNDPEYINRLYLVGSPQLVRAWLDGDWQVRIEGAFFPELSDRHIIQPFEIPKHWPKYGGYDWGYHSDFAHVFGAISSGKDDNGNELPYRQGAIVIYRESHGRTIANVDQARIFRDLTVSDNLTAVYADPSIWANKGGPSIHDEFEANNYRMMRADNHRISGWAQIRMRLSTDMLYMFSSCPYLIQTLRALPIDKKNAADCDTTAPDHACLTGDTLVATPNGPARIDSMPDEGQCISPAGDVIAYQVAAQTKASTNVWRITLQDGSTVTATADHIFLTACGWQTVSSLACGTLILCGTYDHNNQPEVPRVSGRALLPMRALLQQAGQQRCAQAASSCVAALQRAYPSDNAHSSYRWGYTQQSDFQSRDDAYCAAFIDAYDAREAGAGEQDNERKSQTEGYRMAQERSGQSLALEACDRDSKATAIRYDGMQTLQKELPDQNFNAPQITVLPSKLQDERTAKKIKSIEYAGIAPVYCLYVEDGHAFQLANGIISSNCDALRYLCKARVLDPSWTPPKQEVRLKRVPVSAYIAQKRAALNRPKL